MLGTILRNTTMQKGKDLDFDMRNIGSMVLLYELNVHLVYLDTYSVLWIWYISMLME